MTPDLIVVTCGAKKLPGRHRARDLYIGSYFRSALRYADILPCPTLIISAKYGLIRPHDLIDSYDMTLGDPGSVTLETVRSQADRFGLTHAQTVFGIAGRRYLDLLSGVWPDITNPAGGPGVGLLKQRSNLKRLYDVPVR